MNEAASARRPDQRAAPAPVFRGRYLSITSYKRDGRGVATPVWFVLRDGRLLVETDAASGKVKRIRRNPQVRVAVCTASGRLRGTQVPAVAQILPDSETGAVERLIADKYRFDMIIFKAAPVRPGQAAPGTPADRVGDPGHHARLTGSPAAGPTPSRSTRPGRPGATGRKPSTGPVPSRPGRYLPRTRTC